MDNPVHSDVMIIGAGISGLICATELQREKLSVQLIDKGRGFGGRMATRRMAGAGLGHVARLDHGAQYFTVRTPGFQRYVDEWFAAGIIREWFRHLPGDHHPDGYPRYCGVNGMTDVPRYLAQSLRVHRSEEVCRLTRTSEGWEAVTLSGARFTGNQLVVTAPLPQALALIDTSGTILPEALRSVQYEKGLATLATLDGPSGLPAPGGIKIGDGILSWIADNQMKGISPDVPAMTLHATASFAERHWDSPDVLRGQIMLEAAAPYLKASVKDYQCHRWGFTTAADPWPERCFFDEGLNLALAGDGFGSPRIEGAALSGLAAADRLLSSLHTDHKHRAAD